MESRTELTNIISISNGDGCFSTYHPADDISDPYLDEDEAAEIFRIILFFIALVVTRNLFVPLNNVWVRESSTVNHAIEKRAEKYIRYIRVIGMNLGYIGMKNEER